MSVPVQASWADLQAWCFGGPRRLVLWKWVAIPLACVLAIVAPVAFAALVAALALFALLWRKPHFTGLLLIALMGNVKINYYAGFFTVFPEYPVLMLAGVVWVLRSWESPVKLVEPRIYAWFLAWIVAGACSIVSAYNIPHLFSKLVLLLIAAAVFGFMVQSVRNQRDLERAMNWLKASSAVVAAYGIAQMIGVYTGVDMNLHFLARWGNPEFEYRVGAPVLYRFTSTFRANSLFNDPNILAGYLAAVLPVVTVRLLTPTASRGRGGVLFDVSVFFMLLLTLMLTLSRSGMIGAMCGLLAALIVLPHLRRSRRLWLGLAGGVALALIGSAAVGVNMVVMFARLAGAIEGTEFSARVHTNLVQYSLELIRRFPLTGVGLHNFSEYYQREVDPTMPHMMAHNMWLTNFVETGLLGGMAYVMLFGTIVMRPIRVLRARLAVEMDPHVRATLGGLLGGMVSLAVTNTFYDFSLRTFVWVIAGLTVAASRVARTDDAS